MTRDEHLQCCKRRALAYLPGDPTNAMASMISDLKSHDETRNHIGLQLAPMFYGAHRDPEEVRKWIEGFN